MRLKPDYLSFPMLSFSIIRINIIITIFKSIFTTIITSIVVAGAAAIVYVAIFSNFIAYKLFLVFQPLLTDETKTSINGYYIWL